MASSVNTAVCYSHGLFCGASLDERSRANIPRSISRTKSVNIQNSPRKWRTRRSTRRKRAKACRVNNTMIFWVLLLLFAGDSHTKMSSRGTVLLHLHENVPHRSSSVAAGRVMHSMQVVPEIPKSFPELGILKSFVVGRSRSRYSPQPQSIPHMLARALRDMILPMRVAERPHTNRLTDSTNAVIHNPSQNDAYSVRSDYPSPQTSEPQTKNTIINNTATRTNTSTASPPSTAGNCFNNLQTPHNAAQQTEATGDGTAQTPSGRLPERENEESSDEWLPDGRDEGDEDKGDEDDEGEDEDGEDEDGEDEDGEDEDGEDEDEGEDHKDDDEDEDDNEDDNDDNDEDDDEYTELYGSDEEMDEGELEDWTEVGHPNGFGNQSFEILSSEAREQYLRNLTASVDWLIAIIEG